MANFSNFDNFNGQPRVVPGSQEIRGKFFSQKLILISFYSHSPKNWTWRENISQSCNHNEIGTKYR